MGRQKAAALGLSSRLAHRISALLPLFGSNGATAGMLVAVGAHGPFNSRLLDFAHFVDEARALLSGGPDKSQGGAGCWFSGPNSPLELPKTLNK